MKTAFALILSCLILTGVSGCASRPSSHGIENLALVKPGMYRGGQPKDIEAWRYLKDVLGVSDVYKLNSEREGSSRDAVALGMVVHYVPVNIWQQCGLQKMPANFGIVTACPAGAIVVQCEHGRERTGAFCNKVRRKDGWSKADAEKEMLAMGFRRSPLSWGLWKYVEDAR